VSGRGTVVYSMYDTIHIYELLRTSSTEFGGTVSLGYESVNDYTVFKIRLVRNLVVCSFLGFIIIYEMITNAFLRDFF
jgi:hypothetical protein